MALLAVGHERCLYQAVKVDFGLLYDVLGCIGLEEAVYYVAIRREFSVFGLPNLLGRRDVNFHGLFCDVLDKYIENTHDRALVDSNGLVGSRVGARAGHDGYIGRPSPSIASKLGRVHAGVKNRPEGSLA